MEISEQNRARWLWLIVGVTAVYGLINVIMFYTTDSFGPVWFAASLVVYGVLLVAAVALALLDTGRAETEAKAPVVTVQSPVTVTEPEPTPEPKLEAEPPKSEIAGLELVDHEVLYEVPTGRVLQVTARTDGVDRSLIFAITRDEVLSASEIESRLDEVDIDPPEIKQISDVDAALDHRSDRPRNPTVSDDSVPVEILDHEVLYEVPSGAVLEVTYRVREAERTDLFVVTDDEVLPISEIDADLEGIERSTLPAETLDELEAALRARSAPAGTPAPSAEPQTEAIQR